MVRYAVTSRDYVTPKKVQPVNLDLWSSVGSLQGTEVVEVSHAPARR